MYAKILLAAALVASTYAAAVPGSADPNALRKQTCGVGCVAGLLVMAGLVICIGSFLMCCIFWPSPELKSRIEKRETAKKRLSERRAAEAEVRRKDEELERDDESEEEEEHRGGH